MDYKKTFLTFSLILILSTTVSAQQQNNTETNVTGGEVEIEGLNFEAVNETFTDTGVKFEVYGQEINLSSQTVLSPDNISEHITFSNYNYKEAPQGEVIEWTGYTFEQGSHYGNPDLNALLGNTAGSGDAEQWSYYSEEGLVEYPQGTIVEFEGSYYEAQLDTNNVYTPEEAPTNWEQLPDYSPGGNTSYPANYFQTGAVSEISRTNQTSNVFDTFVVDKNQDYNVTLDINAESHYEHLILTYQLNYENNTGTETVHQWQDIYSGNDTDRIPVNSTVERESDRMVSQKITKDNLYENKTTEKLVIAHQSGTSLAGINWSNLTHKEIDQFNYNETVKTELDRLNFPNSSYIQKLSEYEFKVYNVTFPENSKKTIEIRYNQPYYNPLEDENPEKYDFNYYNYIVGSLATFKTNSNSEWNTGSFSQTRSINGKLQLDDKVVHNPSSGALNDKTYYWLGSASNEEATGQANLSLPIDNHITAVKMYGDSFCYEGCGHYYNVKIILQNKEYANINNDLTESPQVDTYRYMDNIAGNKFNFDSYTKVYSDQPQRILTWVPTDQDLDRNEYFNIDTRGNEHHIGYNNDDTYTNPDCCYFEYEGYYTPDIDLFGFYKSGSYDSQIYTATEKKIWDNVTLSGVTTAGGIDLTVETSDDGFSSILETETIPITGADTYDLSFTEPAKDVRYSLSYDYSHSSNLGTPSINSIEIDGYTANFKPVLSSIEPVNDSIIYTNSPELSVTASDENGDDLNITFYNAETDNTIGNTQENVPEGTEATVTWNDLNYGQEYKWYAEITDGKATTTTDTANFTIKRSPQLEIETPLDNTTVPLPVKYNFSATCYTGTECLNLELQTFSKATSSITTDTDSEWNEGTLDLIQVSNGVISPITDVIDSFDHSGAADGNRIEGNNNWEPDNQDSNFIEYDSGQATDGSLSAYTGQLSSVAAGPFLTKKFFDNPRKPDKFVSYYRETSASHGHGLSLRTNDNRQVGWYVGNPQFGVYDANGFNGGQNDGSLCSSDSYDTWYKVTMDFNWEQRTFTVTRDDGCNPGTFDIPSGIEGFSSVSLENGNAQDWGSGGSDIEAWWDGLKFEFSNQKYESKTFSPYENHNWKNLSITGTEPGSSSYNIEYGVSDNTSTFEYFNDLSNAPESDYLKYRINFNPTSTDTPTVDTVNIDYETQIPQVLNQTTQIQNNTYNQITYDYKDFFIPQDIQWRINLTQANGVSTVTKLRNHTVRTDLIPSKWEKHGTIGENLELRRDNLRLKQ
jgi:hypothetical protein